MPLQTKTDESSKAPPSANEKAYSKTVVEKRDTMSSTVTNGESSKQGFNGIDVGSTKGQPSKKQPVFSTMPVPPPRKGRKRTLSGSDSLILRLNELLKPATNLNSVLANVNYGLYLAIYLHNKSAPLRAKLHRHPKVKTADDVTISIQGFERSPTNSITSISPITSTSPISFISTLSHIFHNASRTLRLFSLIPRYAKTRTLLKGAAPGQDWTIHKIAVIQSFIHGAHELLESLAFLTEKRILARGLTALWTKDLDHRAAAASIYALGYRVWFLAFSCDVLSLFWKVHVALHHQRDEANVAVAEKKDGHVQAEKESHLYTELVFPLAGLPISWQLSAGAEKSFPGFIRSLCFVAGVLENVARTSVLWEETEKLEG